MEELKVRSWKPILQLQYPKLKPEDGEYDYRESKLLIKCKLAQPNWDTAQNSVLYNLIVAQRSYKEAHEHLRVTREGTRDKYVANDQQWVELRHKEETLKHSFIKFEQFITENEDKRKRAVKKIAEEKQMQVQRMDQIQTLRKRHAFILEIKQKLETVLKDYRIYEDYIVKVLVESSGQFKNVDDILKRYQSLIDTKKEVGKKRDREMDETDALKMELVKMTEEKQLKLMALNTVMLNLLARFEKAMSKSVECETMVETIKAQTELKKGEISAVRCCMWNMYLQMCERRKDPITLKKHEFEEQLVYIKKSLYFLKKVHTLVVNKKPTGALKVRRVKSEINY